MARVGSDAGEGNVVCRCVCVAHQRVFLLYASTLLSVHASPVTFRAIASSLPKMPSFADDWCRLTR
jgi:hypothetical protein